MKKILLFAAAAAMLGSCSNQPKYVIEGDVADLEGTVYMFQGDSLVDSAKVNKGKFRFKGAAGTPELRVLMDSRDGQPQAFAMQLIIEPGTISIKSDADDANLKHATGTPANDASDVYMTASRALVAEYRNPTTSDERREAIEEEFEQLGRKSVDANRDNFFGALIMQNMVYELSGQELLDEIAKFSPEMQQTKELSDLKATAEQKLKTEVGQPYIDIEQKNAQGETVSLKSVIENPANKYTLVDFWASWCGPCMGEIPHLKETYDKFHKKGFEIYGVSFDANRDNWLAAIENNGMAWIQVSDLNRFDNPAAKDYAVQSIPSNFLIDTQGVIVAKNLRGEELYKKVEELLGK